MVCVQGVETKQDWSNIKGGIRIKTPKGFFHLSMSSSFEYEGI